jgi:cleavage and polyadenylation specificity factor subunit 4
MEMLLLGTDEHSLTDVEKAIVEQKDLKPVGAFLLVPLCTAPQTSMIVRHHLAVQLPFAAMDKTGRGVCVKFVNGHCEMGELCPLRHIIKCKTRRLVCRHWLRGLCMSGDRCDFLHEYIPSLMPECVFFSTEQQCNNPDCEFRHVDPSSKPPAVMDRRGES